MSLSIDMTSEPVALLEPHTQRLRSTNATRPAVNAPDEILAQIFEWVVHGALSADSVFHPDIGWPQISLYRLARTRICGTCWRWRHVAITGSSLWTKLLIYAIYGGAQSAAARTHPSPDILAYDVTNAGQRMISLDMYGSQGLEIWDSTILPALTPIAGRL